MNSVEVEAFLNMLANDRLISPSTHKQTVSELLFLYRVPLLWIYHG